LKHIDHFRVEREYQENFLKDHSDYDERNPMSMLIDQEMEQEIERAINALPEQYRRIIELTRLQELSYEEIAAKLDIPVGSIGPQLIRARKKLMKLLKNKT